VVSATLVTSGRDTDRDTSLVVAPLGRLDTPPPPLRKTPFYGNGWYWDSSFDAYTFIPGVDTKKKELVGDFKNGGRELRPKGQPEQVRVHDFVDPELGRATPYGIYDLGRNSGWVSVGMDHDTAEFAVETIRRWWRTMGRPAYPEATRLLITADAGGSNGSRLRLWKVELQKLADETGLRIAVCHFPPGTSKWNKIEHRLFSYLTQNWRGKPLRSFQAIVHLIAATTPTSGLKVHAELNTEAYQSGIKVSDEELALVKIRRDKFYGDWNYEIQPRDPIH